MSHKGQFFQQKEEKKTELYTINLKNFPLWKSKQMNMFNENCSGCNLHAATLDQ
jgi:hypothetical protein